MNYATELQACHSDTVGVDFPRYYLNVTHICDNSQDDVKFIEELSNVRDKCLIHLTYESWYACPTFSFKILM